MAVPGKAYVNPASDDMHAPNIRKIPMAVRPRGDVPGRGVAGEVMDPL
jgi:hypothetical protein